MTVEKYSFEETSGIRRIEAPATAPCFRDVTRIWHFPNGEVLLEREERCDCLLPSVDQIDISASDCQRVGEAVALDTDATVEVTEEQGGQTLTEIDGEVSLYQ